MINSVKIQKFRCFKEFNIQGLGPFNVLIGPNDSGKTAFLEAIRLVGSVPPDQTASASVLEEELGVRLGAACVWRQRPSEVRIIAKASAKDWDTQDLQLTSDSGEQFSCEFVREIVVEERDPQWKPDFFSESIGKTSYYRLDPSALRQPSPLSIPMIETGEGFPAFLDAINRKHRQVFGELEREFYRRFPYYKTIIIDIEKRHIVGRAGGIGRPMGERDCFLLRFRTPDWYI